LSTWNAQNVDEFDSRATHPVDAQFRTIPSGNSSGLIRRCDASASASTSASRRAPRVLLRAVENDNDSDTARRLRDYHKMRSVRPIPWLRVPFIIAGN